MAEGLRIRDLAAATTPIGLDDLLEIETAAGNSRKVDRVDVLAPKVQVVSDAAYVIADRYGPHVVIASLTTTDRAVSLPDSGSDDVEVGDEFELHRSSDGTGVLTLAAQGTDTIDGEASVALPSQYNYARVRYLGSGLYSLVAVKATFDSGAVSIQGAVIGSTNLVAHNLSVPMARLLIDVTMQDDAGSFRVASITFDAVSGSALNRGFTFEAVDNDSFSLQIGANGIWHLDSSGTNVLMNNSDAVATYRVIVARVLGI